MPFDSRTSASSRTLCCACATASPYPGTTMTFCAYPSRMAASSALIERIDRPSSVAAAVAAPPAGAAPNAPKSTFPRERFMAFDMSRVRMVPEAPTSVPATMRSWFPRVKPAIATARPVYAFRSEITTGMSAPPMGNTSATPNTRASSVIAAMMSIGSTAIAPVKPAARSTNERTPTARTSAAVTTCCPP